MNINAYLQEVKAVLQENAEEIAALDQAIGDGDHLINLQRGLNALIAQTDDLAALDLSAAFSKIGMTLMSTMGGASGSLFGSMFVTMGKIAKDKPVDFTNIVSVFAAGVDAIKARGKADIGEKTMLDTLIPAANSLQKSVDDDQSLEAALSDMKLAAETGMLTTKDMLATKGRASFLGERARGHIDAGARTSQLILFSIADVLIEKKLE